MQAVTVGGLRRFGFFRPCCICLKKGTKGQRHRGTKKKRLLATDYTDEHRFKEIQKEFQPLISQMTQMNTDNTERELATDYTDEH